MKTIRLPNKMVDEIRKFIGIEKKYGYESIAEFVRSAVRARLLEPRAVHIGMLISCAYMRNVAGLQHRTINEFSQFIDDVMAGKDGFKEYQFDWNDHNAIETWIEKFYNYCKKEYK